MKLSPTVLLGSEEERLCKRKSNELQRIKEDAKRSVTGTQIYLDMSGTLAWWAGLKSICLEGEKS
ncbi:unnamed protein product, partial [Gulo gulo]